MSRAPVNYKRKALELDSGAKSSSKVVTPSFTQWLIHDSAGELIGWSETHERNSRVAWMRAFFALEARDAK